MSIQRSVMDKSRGVKKMEKDRKEEFNEILSVWKERQRQEEEFLHFADIRDKMLKKNTPKEPKKWYEKKVQRRLAEMCEQKILEKKKNGPRGAEAQYKPTFEAKEFDINHFFKDIRESSKQKGLVIRENESLLVYGIPKKETLTPLESAILQHIVEQIENSFENLFLLKKSIKAREKIGEPLDAQLITNYVKEKIAEKFSNMIATEAELKGTEEHRKGKLHGMGEMMIEAAKKNNIRLEGAEELTKQEQELMNYSKWHSDFSIYVPKGPDADLAILETLGPDRLAEYELNPFNQLIKLIESWETSDFDETQGCYVARTPRRFDDADIFYLAQAFVRHMSPMPQCESSLTRGQIERLAEWGKLPFELGSTNSHEKLIRCIYLFWKEHQDSVKADKEAKEAWQKLSPEEKQKHMKPHKCAIIIPKVDTAKIERITPEILAAVKTEVTAEIERKIASWKKT